MPDLNFWFAPHSDYILRTILVGGSEVVPLLAFLISLVPFLELRFAIPAAIIANPGMSAFSIFAICVLLNILATPIAFVLLDFVVPPMRRRWNSVDRIFRWADKRARKHRDISLVGLALFVGVPLPVTGAYTGALIAYIGGFDRWRSFVAITAGVVIAGLIIWALAVMGILVIQGVSAA